ncbi:MAG TPA: FmdB family zinc ribbon protein [Acidimicrobiales bacterium]|nr:FmdB family zinc ribbon protein [Acidimicrobiales bacterium]
MPTYEYACKACGEHLEVVQSFKDDPLTDCPNCGGELRKVFGSIGITFKGSGFYKTDSRPASSSTKSDAPKTESSGSGGESKAS